MLDLWESPLIVEAHGISRTDRPLMIHRDQEASVTYVMKPGLDTFLLFISENTFVFEIWQTNP